METKTFSQMNQKLQAGKAVVLTAEEVSRMSNHSSSKEIFKEVDVVTTATYAPMCSSGIFMNFGHTDPPMRMEKATINNVPVYCGIAAVAIKNETIGLLGDLKIIPIS